jgi:hypothetical protein
MKKEPSAVADCHGPFTGNAVSGKKRESTLSLHAILYKNRP